jgi:hypothetical protein
MTLVPESFFKARAPSAWILRAEDFCKWEN